MSEQSVHRFGDRTPPEIPGKYEFFGRRYGNHLGAKNVQVDVVVDFGHLCVMESYPVGLSYYVGRWWGPYEEPVQGDLKLFPP